MTSPEANFWNASNEADFPLCLIKAIFLDTLLYTVASCLFTDNEASNPMPIYFILSAALTLIPSTLIPVEVMLCLSVTCKDYELHLVII